MYATIDEAFEAHVASRVEEAVIRLLIDYVQIRHGNEAAAAAEGFLSNWQDSRLPTYNELDTLVVIQRDGQDPKVWWAEQIRSGQTRNPVNGGTVNGNID